MKTDKSSSKVTVHTDTIPGRPYTGTYVGERAPDLWNSQLASSLGDGRMETRAGDRWLAGRGGGGERVVIIPTYSGPDN